MTSQQERIRRAFTEQANTYANSAVVAADEARQKFVEFVAPRPGDRVLDVATGPGFLAMLFAPRAAEVIGIDLTLAMLARAETNRAPRGLSNVSYREGDAEALPFADGAFDIATCGSAFHHFPQPERVLREMVRVTAAGGSIALSDIICSEVPSQAALHNQLENWRDPSHARSLPLSELERLCVEAGLHNIRSATYGTPRELEEWFAISRTPAEAAARVRDGFVASMPTDAAGLHAHFEGERICFTHTFAWVVGLK